MLDAVGRWLFDPAGLTPHGFCLLWDPGLIWLHAISDIAIGCAYMTIPLAIAIFVKLRPDIVFRPVFVLFAAFIVLCGMTHWLSLLTLWVPSYGVEGLVKAITAVVSVTTAVALWLLMPQALLLPSPAQLREVNEALSERDKRAVEMARLNTDLEQFTYVASHDLRAPLHAIARLAEWVDEDLKNVAAPETLENLRLMRTRADRLGMLIESLLTYAKLGHGKAPVEAVKLDSLIKEIADSIGPPPGFNVCYRGEDVVIMSQRPPLEHVCRNLISNAIKHHDRPTGDVVVSARILDGVPEVRVQDDGPGIAPAFQKRVFAIFQTLHCRDDSETSGIGLSIVQKWVEQAGGRVWIESAPPQRGATFVFTWPDATQPEVDAKAA